MAKMKDTSEDEGGETKSTLKSVVMGGLIAIFIGGGSGFGLGYFTGVPATSPSPTNGPQTSETATTDPGGPTEEAAAQDHEGSKTDIATDGGAPPAGGEGQTFVTALDPIVTNLTDPKDMWIRLELVMTSDAPLAGDLPSQIHQDLFAHVRAMRLSEMEGPSAFIDLKAELLARARQRSEGHVQKVYVKTLLYE